MREEFKIRLDEYIAELRKTGPDQIAKVRSDFANWYYSLPEENRGEMEPFWEEIKGRARQTIKDIKAALNEIQQLNDVKIIVAGAEYDLHEWITISEYSRVHNLKVSRVQNWISRGVVPRDKVLAIPQLNNVKLIKNEVYTTGV